MTRQKLPNLIIPGAQKSGTTYLVSLLAQHPKIFVPTAKEPAYFLANRFDEIVWPNGKPRRYAFKDLEDYLSLYENAPTESLWRVDATTGYFCYPDIASAVKEMCGSCKVICLIRQPVERAWSAHQYQIEKGGESINDFQEALRFQENRDLDKTVAHPYIETGMYAQNIGHWVKNFGLENVHILTFENLIKNSQKELDKILDFLRVEGHDFNLKTEKNQTTSPPTGIKRLVLEIFVTGSDNTLRRLLRALIPSETREKIRRKFKRHLRGKQISNEVKRPNPAVKSELMKIFSEDMEALERVYNVDLSQWK